ncbi:MAG: hypothetical protein KatS3mg027_1986 [Bacteroidia bacterium]|nr:MAG: hypothetical protein KatS3mg027_1986 [Bacteroidia bacterium]
MHYTILYILYKKNEVSRSIGLFVCSITNVSKNRSCCAIKADLKNIQALCEKLGYPEKKLRFIHIAGTNGKGISFEYVGCNISEENGYKTTGLFTSPHLIDFRERIRINGEMISKRYVTSFVKKI